MPPEMRKKMRYVVLLIVLGSLGSIIYGFFRLEEATGKEITYTIVGEDEADIKHGRISYTSPIARALISKNEGDVVDFVAPDGEKVYEVLEVRYE